ncbi:MAG: hypothetical protein ACE5E8_09875, partial [Acidimicrobiia bacterium]
MVDQTAAGLPPAGRNTRSRRTIGRFVVLALATTAVFSLQSTDPATAKHDKMDGCGQQGAISYYTPDFDIAGITAAALALQPDVLAIAIADGVSESNFQAWCNYHDLCYGTLWTTQSQCDDTFFVDLEAVCRQKYLPGKSWKSWIKVLSSPLYPVCIAQSGIYWTAVHYGAGDTVAEAQSHAEEFIDCDKVTHPLLSGVYLDSQAIQRAWGCSRMVDVSYGDGAGGTGVDCPPNCATARWTAVFSPNTGYTKQGVWIGAWDDIRAKYLSAWDDNLRITDLESGAGDQWSLVYSGGSGYGQQGVKPPSSWNNALSYIEEQWNQSFAVTDIEHGNGGWVVVVSKGTGITSQRVISRGSWDEIVNEFE